MNTHAPAPAPALATTDELEYSADGFPLYNGVPVSHGAYAMVTKPHGGGCCGMTHVNNMGYDGPHAPDSGVLRIDSDQGRKRYSIDGMNGRSKLEALKRAVDVHNSKGGGIRVLEVVVTDKQCNAGDKGRQWPDELSRLGFVEVSHFKNSNSSQICRVFHYSKCHLFAEFQAGKKAPENKEITVVKTFYTPLFRDGRRGAICDSSAEVRAVAPLVRRYSLVSIMSDGSVTYADEDLEAVRPPLQGA